MINKIMSIELLVKLIKNTFTSNIMIHGWSFDYRSDGVGFYLDDEIYPYLLKKNLVLYKVIQSNLIQDTETKVSEMLIKKSSFKDYCNTVDGIITLRMPSAEIKIITDFMKFKEVKFTIEEVNLLWINKCDYFYLDIDNIFDNCQEEKNLFY